MYSRSFLERLSVIIREANNQLYERADVFEKQQKKNHTLSAEQDKQSEIGLRIGISAVLGREKNIFQLILCPY